MHRTTRELSPALEDYLQAILNIEQRKRVARVRDISRAMDVHKSSVTAALHSLSEKGLVSYQPYEAATLSKEGLRVARELAERHEILREFLEQVLGIEPELADSGACQVEHAVHPKVLDRVLCFLAFLSESPRRQEALTSGFKRFCARGAGKHSCRECVERYLQKLRAAGRRVEYGE